MAQEDLSVENIGPNLFSTKPGLTYFLEEIQTPMHIQARCSEQLTTGEYW
jgi:hypothetical protein